MKIFISQKMRGKTQKEIIKERNAILNGYLLHGNPDAKIKKEVDEFKNKLLNEETFTQSVIKRVEVGDIVIDLLQSYNSELKFKSPIDALSHSLAMLDEADIVLVPRSATEIIKKGLKYQRFCRHIIDAEHNHPLEKFERLSNCELLKGCEFEFLIAKSYGKKVYTYDENYTFEEV